MVRELRATASFPVRHSQVNDSTVSQKQTVKFNTPKKLFEFLFQIVFNFMCAHGHLMSDG